MKLQEIFDLLSGTDFHNLSLAGRDNGVIDETVWPKIVPTVNVALTALHTRFQLREGMVKIELLKGRQKYPLIYAHAQSNTRSREDDLFIVDSPTDKFRDDVIKIEKLVADSGWEMTLNDASKKVDYRTPTMNTLMVPKVVLDNPVSLDERLRTKYLEVVYRANHPKIVIPQGYFDPERVEVELPYTHLKALCFHIASQVFNPVGMQGDFHAGNTYYAKYENECRQLLDQGMETDKDNQPDKFRLMGWA